MSEVKYKKVPARQVLKLNVYPIYRDAVYNGKEPLKIVGIRENEIELEGDYSGGTHAVKQKEWTNIDDCYAIKTVCKEQLKENWCQVHNIYCCGGGSILTSHIDKYWEHLI